MKQIIFARPRQQYDSYIDFWHIVKLSGFPVLYLDEVDWSQPDLTVIATPKNVEWSLIEPRHNARLIWWTIERMANSAESWDMANPFVPPCVDKVWTSDASLARKHGWKYVFLGGHRAFGCVDVMHKQYDIITLMAPLPRRIQFMSELRRFSVADTGSLHGKERDIRLRQSRLLVMCHQDELPICEPPRMMIGGSYAMPILCEVNEDSGYWKEGVHYIAERLDRLVMMAEILLQDPVHLARLGAAAWRLVAVEHPFRETVEAAA